MRHAAGHKQEDHALGFRRKVRLFRRERVAGIVRLGRLGGIAKHFGEQAGQDEPASG